MSLPKEVDAQLAVSECRAEIALAERDHEVDMARDHLALAKRDLALVSSAGGIGGVLALTGGGLLLAGLGAAASASRMLGKNEADKRLATALEAREQAAKSLASVRTSALAPSKPKDLTLSEWQDLRVETSDGPESWLVRALPQTESVRADGMNLDPIWIDSLARQAPRLAELMSSGQIFELVGPGVALEGLRSGLFELVPAKAGGVLGAVRAVGGTQIEHQARFAAQSAFSAAAPGLAVSVASAVLGHMHMVEIRKSLAGIESALKGLRQNEISRLFGDVHGPIRSLEGMLTEVAAGQPFDDPSRVRLERLGDELEKVCHELTHQQTTFASNLTNLGEPTVGDLNTYFEKNRTYERHGARLLLDARSAVVMVKRLRLEQQRKAGSRLQVFQDQLDAAIASLRAFEADVAFSTKLHEACRSALDAEHASSVRLRSGHTERLSTHLREDRIEFALLIRTMRQRVAALDGSAEARVLRLDLSGPEPRATVALTESDAWLVGDGPGSHQAAEPAHSAEQARSRAEASNSRGCQACDRQNPEQYLFCLGCGSRIHRSAES